MLDVPVLSTMDVSALVAIGALLGLVLLGAFGFRDDPLRERLEALDRSRRDTDDSVSSLWLTFEAMVPWRDMVLWSARIIDPEKFLGKKEATNMRALLVSAGWRSRTALVSFVFCKIALFLLFGVAVALAIFGFGWLADWPILAHLGVVVGGMFIGGMIPENFLKRYVARRLERIRSFLPDVTDMMIICLRSGLGLEDTLNRVWQEIEGFAPDLSDELRVTALEYRMLEDRIQAMRNLARRIDLEEIHTLVMTTVQAEKYGTSMSDAMGIMADESRKKRISRAEAWATRVPVLMTLPLVAFLMPVFMILIAGPAISNITSVFGQL